MKCMNKHQRSPLAQQTYRKEFHNLNEQKGKDLSHANIQGIDWSNVNLERSSFYHVCAGLPRANYLALIVILAGLAGLVGTSVGATAVLATGLLGKDNTQIISSWLGSVVLVWIFIGMVVAIERGFINLLRFSMLVALIAVPILFLSPGSSNWNNGIGIFVYLLILSACELVALWFSSIILIAGRSISHKFTFVLGFLLSLVRSAF